MEIVIEKGIALPDDLRGGRTLYPFDKMDVGDSMFFVLKEGDNAQRMKNRLGLMAKNKSQNSILSFVIA